MKSTNFTPFSPSNNRYYLSLSEPCPAPEQVQVTERNAWDLLFPLDLNSIPLDHPHPGSVSFVNILLQLIEGKTLTKDLLFDSIVNKAAAEGALALVRHIFDRAEAEHAGKGLVEEELSLSLLMHAISFLPSSSGQECASIYRNTLLKQPLGVFFNNGTPLSRCGRAFLQEKIDLQTVVSMCGFFPLGKGFISFHECELPPPTFEQRLHACASLGQAAPQPKHLNDWIDFFRTVSMQCTERASIAELIEKYNHSPHCCPDASAAIAQTLIDVNNPIALFDLFLGNLRDAPQESRAAVLSTLTSDTIATFLQCANSREMGECLSCNIPPVMEHMLLESLIARQDEFSNSLKFEYFTGKRTARWTDADELKQKIFQALPDAPGNNHYSPDSIISYLSYGFQNDSPLSTAWVEKALNSKHTACMCAGLDALAHYKQESDSLIKQWLASCSKTAIQECLSRTNRQEQIIEILLERHDATSHAVLINVFSGACQVSVSEPLKRRIFDYYLPFPNIRHTPGNLEALLTFSRHHKISLDCKWAQNALSDPKCANSGITLLIELLAANHPVDPRSINQLLQSLNKKGIKPENVNKLAHALCTPARKGVNYLLIFDLKGISSQTKAEAVLACFKTMGTEQCSVANRKKLRHAIEDLLKVKDPQINNLLFDALVHPCCIDSFRNDTNGKFADFRVETVISYLTGLCDEGLFPFERISAALPDLKDNREMLSKCLKLCQKCFGQLTDRERVLQGFEKLHRALTTKENIVRMGFENTFEQLLKHLAEHHKPLLATVHSRHIATLKSNVAMQKLQKSILEHWKTKISIEDAVQWIPVQMGEKIPPLFSIMLDTLLLKIKTEKNTGIAEKMRLLDYMFFKLWPADKENEPTYMNKMNSSILYFTKKEKEIELMKLYNQWILFINYHTVLQSNFIEENIETAILHADNLIAQYFACNNPGLKRRMAELVLFLDKQLGQKYPENVSDLWKVLIARSVKSPESWAAGSLFLTVLQGKIAAGIDCQQVANTIGLQCVLACRSLKPDLKDATDSLGKLASSIEEKKVREAVINIVR